MNEVRIYSVLLVVLLLAAYTSWTREEPGETDTKVVLLEAQPEEIKGLKLVTRTQTISLSWRDLQGERTPWFTTKSRTRTRQFAGNSEVKTMVKRFAPFEALRSLGKDLSEEELKTTKLDANTSKLTVAAGNTERSFVVGGKTGGSRDFYVQRAGDSEVLLVASKTLSELQYPDGKFMQRKLRRQDKKDVVAIEVEAGGVKKRLLQQNRLAPTEAFWSAASTPDEKNDELGAWADKLEKLTVLDYLESEDDHKKGTEVFTARYLGEDDKVLSEIKLRRDGDGKKATYTAMSTATRWPVKVTRFTAEDLEKTLATVLGP